MSRPERLFPLFADLETLEGVGPKSARALAGLRNWPDPFTATPDRGYLVGGRAAGDR